jgi:hypothetical protein
MIKVIKRIAYKCGDLLASPWTILVLALISLTAFPQAILGLLEHGDVGSLVGWFSQNFVQLVALAVLAFIADQHDHAAAVRADEMYDWLAELHTSLHGLHSKTDELGKKADAIHENVTGS